MATTSTAPYNLFQAVRIRFVEVWSIAAVGTPTTVTVSFAGQSSGLVGDSKIHTDTSIGIEPAHFKAVPLKKYLASNYQISSGGYAFYLKVPANAIIDVGLSYIGESYQGGAQAAQNNSSGATVGTIFFRGLDGLASASTNFPPPSGIPTA
jgi:hypothetical protein